MKKIFPIILLFGILLSCKKEKQKPEESVTIPANQQLTPSNYKRVSIMKKYDTLSSFKKIYTHQYQYSYNTGRLHKEIITDSILNNNTTDVATKTYSYSAGKVDSYTITFSYNTDVLQFHTYIYDAGGKILKEMNVAHSQSNAFPNDTSYLFYSHFGTITEALEYYSSNSGSKDTYDNGDLQESTFLYNGTWFTPTEHSYSQSIKDKSKLFFNETAFLPAECKLLLSTFIPAGPANPNGPTTVSYSYEFDLEGYPVKYENSQGLKWRFYYY